MTSPLTYAATHISVVSMQTSRAEVRVAVVPDLIGISADSYGEQKMRVQIPQAS